MDFVMNFLTSLKALLLRVSEVLGLFITLIVMIYLLLGEASGAFVIDVVTNLSLLIYAISPQTLIAIALVIAVFIVMKSRRS